MRPGFPILIIACLFAVAAAAGETALAWFGDFSFGTKP
jgi:hypothetical protein